MVLHSTKQSLESKEISFLAVVEIIFAVWLYWYIAYRFNFYWHLIISIMIAPLLLLQSQKSISHSLELFKDSKERLLKSAFVEQLDIALGVTIFTVLTFPLLLGFEYLFNLDTIRVNKVESVLLVDLLLALFVMLVLGGVLAGIAFALDTKKDKTKQKEESNNKLIESMLFIFLIFPMGLGIGIGSVLVFTTIKIIVTFSNLRLGYKNIISNWFHHLFVQDMKKTPEVMTGIEGDDEIKDIYKISELFSIIIRSGNILRSILAVVLFVSLYPSALFYRLSLKSTFWFYMPLLLVVKTPSLNNSQNIGRFLSEQYQTIWAWLRGLLAAITLGAFVVTYFQYYAFTEVNSVPFISIISMLYLDFSSIEIWKIFQLLVAVLTIGLFLYSNAIRVPAIENDIPLRKDYHVKTIYYANSVRNWISLFYFISAFVFLAYYFQVWEYQYMPNFMQDLLSNLVQYIRYKPFG